jgi:hypothetical protein
MVEIPAAALALPFPAAALPLPALIQYTFDCRHTAIFLHTYNAPSLTEKQSLAAYTHALHQMYYHPWVVCIPRFTDTNSDCNASVF